MKSQLKFKQAIVKTPCENMTRGISDADLGAPNHHLALQQHKEYIHALQQCGLKVAVLGADETYPDSCFVEDPALLTASCAIITNPGANSRKGETTAIEKALLDFYPKVEHIIAPGTLEGGDVMMVGKQFFIGLSDRTNVAGADQLIAILHKHGMDGSAVEMKDMLHLKTGLSYLENNYLLACGEFIKKSAFESFHVLPVDEDEAYAANCIWVNNKVIAPGGFPKTLNMLQQAGFEVITVDVSEFQKLDGGLSCLSLRF